MITIFILVLGQATAEFLYNNNYSVDAELAELVSKLAKTQPCSVTIVDKLFPQSSLSDEIVKQLSSGSQPSTIVTTLASSQLSEQDSCQLYILLWPSLQSPTIQHWVKIHALIVINFQSEKESC